MGMIQIPGSTCRICGKNIVTITEGTWCVKCLSVFHSACLTKTQSICPKCKSHYIAPSETDILIAYGESPHSKKKSHATYAGPMIEIIMGAILIISPIALLTLGFALRFGGSSGGILVACLLSLIFVVLGATLVVDGDRNFRMRK
jgi:hypothetical protein